MLSLVAQRTLEELKLARMTLTGELPANSLPPVPEAGNEAEHRRLVALNVIDGLSRLLADVGYLAEETDRTIYGWLGGSDLHHEPPPVEEKPRVFGFAAFRKTA